MTAVRLQKIDEQNRSAHFYLTEADECLFLHEYTAGERWDYSDTNQLIMNLKKKRGQGGYQYKAPAIRRCAATLTPALNPQWLANATLVPIPPSKVVGDPLYDDRMKQVCEQIAHTPKPDVREMILQTVSTDAVHEGNRLKPDELRAIYAFNEGAFQNPRMQIGIVDDVLTAGAHFRACKDMILERLPQARIVGIFIARRVFANPFDDLSLDDLLK